MLLFLVPGDKPVKFLLFALPENEIRHVNPGHEFIRLGDFPGSGQRVRIGGGTLEHRVGGINKPAVKGPLPSCRVVCPLGDLLVKPNGRE